MQALRSRRGLVVTLASVVLAVVALAALAVVLVVERPAVAAVSPAPGSAVPTTQPVIAFDAPGGDVDAVSVHLDDRDVTGRVARDGGRLMLRPEALAEGAHTVAVRLRGDNPLARAVSRTWGFTVKTSPPALALAGPDPGVTLDRHAVRFAGTAEPGASVEVAYEGGRAAGAADAEGAWTATARLPEGEVAARVTARDAAGNATQTERRVVVDTTAPVLAVTPPADGGPLTETDQPLIYGTLADEDVTQVVFGATVNGRDAVEIRGSAAVAAGAAPVAPVEAGAVGTGTPLQVDGNRFALAVGTLPQGRNDVTVWVRDAVGNVAKRKVPIMVDSSEELGTAQMVAGARGADVARLQGRLKGVGVYRGKATRTLDKPTVAALKRYQRRFRLATTGRLDDRTRKAMLGRIVVSVGARQLRLIRDGEVAKAYRVAVGTPSHPTPTGAFTITTTQVDPTWSPPDSPWAEGLGPIAPGPGNPLGTRWIGTSSPAIGIHGTYDDGSIGSAASHGCIRMHIPEVEALYEEVAVGMEVRFVA